MNEPGMNECVVESIAINSQDTKGKKKNFVEIMKRNRDKNEHVLLEGSGGLTMTSISQTETTSVTNPVSDQKGADDVSTISDQKGVKDMPDNNNSFQGKKGAEVQSNNTTSDPLEERTSNNHVKENTHITRQRKYDKTTSNKFNSIQDLTDSPQAYMLDKDQVEACQSLEEESASEGKVLSEDLKPKGVTKNKRNRRRATNQSIWNIKEDEKGSVLVEEVTEPGDNAWLLGRDADGCMIHSCLLDTGNNSSHSVMSKAQYDKLCKLKGRTIKLLPYNKPVVAAGSNRLKIYGHLSEPITIFFENFSTPVVTRPLIISSKATHLNISLFDISAMEVDISFSITNGNYLKKGNECIRLAGKREISQLARSSDPDFMATYLNDREHTLKFAKETVTAEEIGEMGKLERNLLNMNSKGRYLCKSPKGYSWCKPADIVTGNRFQDPFVDFDEDWVETGLKVAAEEGIDSNHIVDHTAKAHIKTTVPGGVFTYIPCVTKFPLSTEFICQPVCGQESNLSVMECLLRVSDYKKIVYIPVMNLTKEDVIVHKNEAIAYLQRVEASLEEVKFPEKGKEEKFSSGPLSFYATATASHGPTLVKDKEEAAETIPEVKQMATYHPIFAEEEIDEAERVQRKEYCHRPSRLKETNDDNEDDKEDKRKTKEILQELENKPKFNGTWVEGDIKPLNHHIPPKRVQPMKTKRKLEEVDDAEVKELFRKKLELEDNEYLNSLPKDVRTEVKEELLEVLVRNKLAFTAGEPDNDYVDEQGDCPWIEYQMEMKPEYRNTIFHEKPRPLSLSETEKLRQILVDWTNKGIIRKNTPDNASPHSLNVFIVSKRDVGRAEGAPGRLVFDGRRLCAASVNRQIYLGSVSQTLALLEKNDLYSSLDIGGFFSSIRLSPQPAPGHKYSSQEYCSFHTTSLGSYSYLKCSQGVHSSVNLAASIMQKILEDVPITMAKGFSDDLLLSTKNDSETITRQNWRESSAGGKMIKLLDQILQKIQQGGLKLRLRKVQIMKKSLRFLGFDVSDTGVRVASEVKRALLQEKPASSPKGLRQFLGKILFFKGHLPGYSCFTSRLHEATTRSAKNWALTKCELEDWFSLRRLFITSTALGYPNYDILETSPFRLFIDFSAGGLSCLLTQFQEIVVNDKKEMKEVLLAVIAKKTNKALRNSSSFRGEASALSLALHHLGSMLRTHKWILFTDSLSLLYLSGCKTVHNQLWRLYDQLTKQCFALVHLDTHSNFLSDNYSRLPNLEKLTPEEEQLFTEYIDEVGICDESTCEEESKKGKLLAATAREKQSIKDMQARMLNYAARLNDQQNLVTSEQTAEGIFSSHRGLNEDSLSTIRCHSSTYSNTCEAEAVESLHCASTCYHQTAWLPICNNKSERICISRKNEEQCVAGIQGAEDSDGTEDTQEDAEEDSDFLNQGSQVRPEKKGEQDQGEKLHRLPRLKIPGSLEYPLSPEEIRSLQQQDPVLSHVLKYTNGGWPKVEHIRKQYFTPDVIRYYNMRNILATDDFGILCRKRLPYEECMELRIILPDSLKSKVFKSIHFCHLIHRGLQSTTNAIRHRFYYLGMPGDLRARILSCSQCYISRLRSPVGNKYVPEKESIITQGLCSFNDLVHVDCSGVLPTCNCGENHTSFVIFVDAATSFCAALPLRSKKADNLKNAFKVGWQQHYNLPKTTKFDRGGEFLNKTMISFLEANAGSYTFTPTASARSNYAERKNLCIKRTIRAVLSTMSSQSYWCTVLPDVIRSLNATVSSATGFSPQRLVFGHETPAPLDRLIGKPFYSKEVERIRQEDPSLLSQFKKQRTEELAGLADRENKNQLSEADKARARCLRFAVVRENRLIALSRASERYSGNSNCLFPLKESDEGKAVYFYKSRVPRGKSKSLTQRWVGPNFIVKVLSPVLAELKSGYREICMGKREEYFTTAIDNLYPFPPSHNPLPDCDDPRTELLDDSLDNSLCDIQMPDEFNEYPIPCPFQQAQITGQESINYEKIWQEICSVDESIILSNIFPPGAAGEWWDHVSTRSALDRYKQDTAEYELSRLKGQVTSKQQSQSQPNNQSHISTTSISDSFSDDDDNNDDTFTNNDVKDRDQGQGAEDENEVGGRQDDVEHRRGGEDSTLHSAGSESGGGQELENRNSTGECQGQQRGGFEANPSRSGSLGRMEVEKPTEIQPLPSSSSASLQPQLSGACSALPSNAPEISPTNASHALGRRFEQPTHFRPGKGTEPEPRHQGPGDSTALNWPGSKDLRGREVDNDSRNDGRQGGQDNPPKTRVDWGRQARQQRQLSKQIDPLIRTVPQHNTRRKPKNLLTQLPSALGRTESFLSRLKRHPRQRTPSSSAPEPAEQ